MARTAIAGFDGEGRLRWANPAFRETFSAPAGATLRTVLERLLTEDGVRDPRRRSVAELIRRLRDGEVIELSGRNGAILGASIGLGEDGAALLTVVERPAARMDAVQRLLLDSVAHPLVVSRAEDGILLAVNAQAADLLGIDSRAPGRLSATDLYAEPRDAERLATALRAGNGRVDAFEARLRGAGGRTLWVLLSVRALTLAGEAVLMCGVSDISDRRAMEQDLEAQWEQSRAMMAGLSQGVMAFDRDLRLIVWNRRVLDLLGIEDGFCYMHQPLIEITRYVAQRGGYGAGDVERIVRDRIAHAIGPLPRRNERLRPDGLIMETYTQALPEGGFLTTYTDITERKRAERELADSRELFELAIRAARDGISDADLVTGRLWFSPQWWSLLGYGAGEMVNTRERWAELMLDEDREPTRRLTVDFIEGRVDDFQITQRFRHKAGHTVHLLTRLVKVTDAAGRAVRLVGSHTDITERIRSDAAVRAAKEQAERALRDLKEAQANLIQSEKMAALVGLVAGVAHEINTPVGIALTGASLLADRTAAVRASLGGGTLRKSELTDFLDTAGEATQLMLLNAHRAAELIQSFKQMAVDQASGERRAFDLRDYIHEVLRSLGVRLRRAGHAVTVDCPDALVVDGYPGAFSQVLTNFVMNSIAHAYPPGVRGTLAIRVACSGDDIELRYSDDGRGIPAELHAKVFEPFFTTSRATGGSGLGLNIVYTIATRTLRGRITLDSDAGRGATFILRFPRVVPDERADALEMAVGEAG